MARIVAILLAAIFLATGSGAAEYVHREQHHQGEHHAPLAKATPGRSIESPADDHHAVHSCPTCQALHAPISPAVHQAPLVFIGAASARVRTWIPRLHGQRVPLSIACRGPPLAKSSPSIPV